MDFDSDENDAVKNSPAQKKLGRKRRGAPDFLLKSTDPVAFEASLLADESEAG